jgi:nucleotide-binding universal stress UspA family protein
MAMSNPILVAFDGSEGAERALRFAASTARTQDRPLQLVAVVEWQLFGAQNPMEMAAIEADVGSQITRYRVEVLGPRCAELVANGIQANFQVETGVVVPALEKAAADCGAVQIVVGRRGGSRWSKLLLGSVSSALVQSSEIPVTVVP